MYCEWYGVCDFVVLSDFEVCADYVDVNVFHVCLNFGVVYGVGVGVNVCGVVCVVVCCLFLTSGCCLLQKTQSPLLLRPLYPSTYTLPTEF